MASERVICSLWSTVGHFKTLHACTHTYPVFPMTTFQANWQGRLQVEGMLDLRSIPSRMLRDFSSCEEGKILLCAGGTDLKSGENINKVLSNTSILSFFRMMVKVLAASLRSFSTMGKGDGLGLPGGLRSLGPSPALSQRGSTLCTST